MERSTKPKVSALDTLPVELIESNYATVIRQSGNYFYIGLAAAGSATSSAVWSIQRLDVTVLLDVKWADGDASYNNVMDDYLTLTYN